MMETIAFVRQFPIKSFRKGEIILHEGDSLRSIYAVRSGYIKVTSLSESGHERILWIAGPGNFAPFEQLFSTEGSLLFYYTAISNCELYRIDKAKFIAFTQTKLDLMTDIARRLSSHYDDLLIRVDSVGQANVRYKLIYTLCYLARRFSDQDVVDLYSLNLRLTQNDFAEMIGCTRETTSLELHKLLIDGGITYDRSRFIIDVPKLERL